jgi:hypothetical protein
VKNRRNSETVEIHSVALARMTRLRS